MALLQPSEELAAIVGDEPLSPAQVVEELWGYIRENGLQDARNPRRIKADDHLREDLRRQGSGDPVRVDQGVNRHLFACSEGSPVTDEELGREFEKEMLASCYETLGCSPEMSDEELKRKFRELCQEYHPDRLAGEEIPAGIVKLAEEKFQEIQSAYAVVVESRS